MIAGSCSIAGLLLAVGAEAAGLHEDVVPLNNHRFEIPISIDPAMRRDIRSLELYASTNQGKTWERVGVATPEQTAFQFTAERDGVYWFSVQVIDRQNRKEPPNVATAPVGKKILVDTLKPDVRQVTAERTGENVTVRWEVREENPNLREFRLEYRPANNTGPWTPVQFSASMVGQAVIRNPNALSVRLHARDLAGNATDSVEAKVAGASGVVTASATTTAPPENVTPPTGKAVTPPGGEVVSVPAPDLTAPPPSGGTGLKEVENPPVPVAPRERAVEPRPADVKPPAAGLVIEDLLPPPPSGGTNTGNVVAASTGPATTKATPAALPTETTSPLPPAVEKRPTVRVTNNRRVTLEYEITRHGPSGIGAVDLWVTRDDGVSWQIVKGEHTGPLKGANVSGDAIVRTVSVDLPEDGVYGFYLVVKSGANLSKPGPGPGDAPQMRVELDSRLPDAKLFKPEQNKGDREALLVSWEATDKNLTDAPISIEWAAAPTGPWTPIGAPQLPNTGSFSWKVPRDVPARVFLRLTVRDNAGNLAIAETAQPVLVDLIVPEAHIRGFVDGPRR